MGGVQNGVGHVPVHVHHDESLVQDKGLSQQTGIKSGSGELEGHDINVSDGTVRQEVLSGGQESRGFFATLWNAGANLLGAANEFVGQMNPGLYDDEESVVDEDEFEVVDQRQIVDEDEDEIESSSVKQRYVDIGEIDEDGTVWYDALDGTEEDPLFLEPVPISRQDNLRMDKDSALLREGFRVGKKESDPIEEQAPKEEIQQMNQGFMQKTLGVAYSAWNWLVGGNTKSESVSVQEDTRNVSEKNLGQIEKLQIDTAKCLQKLNEQVEKVTGKSIMDKDQDPSKIKPDVSSLELRDHAWRWSKTAQAAFGQAVSTLGWCAAGAGIAYGGSTVSSLTGGGISGNLVSVLGGSYLALSALRDLPSNVTDQTAIKVIEESLVEINTLLEQVKQLSMQEAQRHELSGKLMMVSQGRMEKIERLELELEVIDRQVVGRKDVESESRIEQSTPRLPVKVGDGSARSETLSGFGRVKQAFSSFFAPVVQGLTRAGQFLGDALGLTRMSLIQKMDRADEQAYEKTFSQGLGLLQQPVNDSIVKTDLLDKTSRRLLGLSQERPTDPREVQQRVQQLDRQSESIKPVLRLGENVVRHIQDGSGGSFGTLVVTDKDDSRYVVNSGQPTTRALCHYFDVLARDVGEDNAHGVRIDDSGGLVLNDPDRRFFQFLAGASNSMTSLFMSPVGAGNEWREATNHAGQMWINDSSGKLPGGANRVVFETSVEDGKDVLKLRFEKLDRDELVSSVFDAPEHSMIAQLRMMSTAYRDAYGSGQVALDELDDEALVQRYENSNKTLGVAGEDYGRWSLESLRGRREQLLKDLAQEQVLLQRDNDSYQLLQNDSELRVISQRV